MMERISYEAVSRLYARKGKALDQETLKRLQSWYDKLGNDRTSSYECLNNREHGRSKYSYKINRNLHLPFTTHNWQNKVLDEIYHGFENARNHGILSMDFRDRAFSAFSLGEAYIDRFADVQDGDGCFDEFVERLVYVCGEMAEYICSQCLESKEERLKISSEDFERDFCMDVYGAFPTRFLNDGVLILGVVKTGAVRVGDYVGFPFLFDSNDYGSYTNAMINSVSEVTELVMFGRRLTEVRAGDVCVMSVKSAGMFLKYDLPYPFQINITDRFPDIRMASLEERVKEYADQYIARHWWDNNILELSVSDRMYMETVRTTLGISKNRAQDIELATIPQLLSKNYLDCFEIVKDCLNDIDAQNLKGDYQY